MKQNSTLDKTISLWREPISVVREGKFGSVIEDKGNLQKAIKASNNWFPFSEKGAGTKALVLVGTPIQVLEFLANNSKTGIVNQLVDLPKIYVGITKYKPQERFKGLFPFDDFITQFVQQLSLDYLPYNTNVDAINVLFDNSTNMVSFIEQLKTLSSKDTQHNDSSENVLYLKFSYMLEEGFIELGEGKIGFDQVLTKLKDNLSKLKDNLPQDNLSDEKTKDDLPSTVIEFAKMLNNPFVKSR